MSYQALWFRSAASQLQLLEQSLDFDSVRAIICDRLPFLVKEMEAKGLDLEEPHHWWELVYIDAVINIENAQGKSMRVAVRLTDNWRLARRILKIVQSRKFCAIRTDLGIDRHWIVYTETKQPLTRDRAVDVLYEQIDQVPGEFGCSLVTIV